MKTNNVKKEENHAKDQAKAQLESIQEMVKDLYDADGGLNEDAQQTIMEDPLSVGVRSGWVTDRTDMSPEEFKILLCWGGPAVQIVGCLDQHGQPENPRLEYQDWFTGWTEYPMAEEEEKDVLTYCEQFYFGE